MSKSLAKPFIRMTYHRQESPHNGHHIVPCESGFCVEQLGKKTVFLCKAQSHKEQSRVHSVVDISISTVEQYFGKEKSLCKYLTYHYISDFLAFHTQEKEKGNSIAPSSSTLSLVKYNRSRIAYKMYNLLLKNMTVCGTEDWSPGTIPHIYWHDSLEAESVLEPTRCID